jgi:hypothetical protein
VQCLGNPTFGWFHLHRLLDPVKSGVEGLFAGEVNEPEVAVGRVTTEA